MCFEVGEVSVKLSIVIPVYNERQTIDPLIDMVLKVETGLSLELIVVDDCSTDDTRSVLERAREKHPEMILLFHDHNQGKGAALRTGFNAVTGDIVLIQDADLEYNPKEYPQLLRPILDGHADVVFGSRFLGGGAHRVVFFWHYVGNKLLTTLSNMMTNLNLTDMEVCYKVFKREVLKDIVICENRFGFEVEITAKVARQKWRIYEVPISYYGRDYAEGKKITWKDGFHALWCILKYRLVD
jgi:glycosyltransferase involved in cell wall biosynthesis